MGEPGLARLRAVWDLDVPTVRDGAGLHEYDGVVPDLSPSGVAAALARLGGDPLEDPHDDAHVAAFEAGLRVRFGTTAEHRRSPLPHLEALDVTCYERDYAPAPERAEARRRHLEAWPDAVDAAIESLTELPGPVALSLLPAVRALGSDVDPAVGVVESAALDAVGRLVAHLERAGRHGPQDAALGRDVLAQLLGAPEGLEVDLAELERQAESETERLAGLLADACARIDPDRTVDAVVAGLVADHPDADGVLAEAAVATAEVLDFTRDRRLVPWTDGDCLVGPTPPAARTGMAMIRPSGPEEPDSPTWFWITPPEASWPPDEQAEWLQVFSRTTLPVIAVHEVAPGHFAHFRCLRRAPSLVRRTLLGGVFIEGWAHYAEELALEEGFRSDDPRFAVGVAVEAAVRVCRLRCSIGLHTGAMSLDDAVGVFERDAHLAGPAARHEAQRGLFDPTYGRYTWGKLALRALRDDARRAWGPDFDLPRFHAAVLELGAPPLGLIRAVLT